MLPRNLASAVAEQRLPQPLDQQHRDDETAPQFSGGRSTGGARTVARISQPGPRARSERSCANGAAPQAPSMRRREGGTTYLPAPPRVPARPSHAAGVVAALVGQTRDRLGVRQLYLGRGAAASPTEKHETTGEDTWRRRRREWNVKNRLSALHRAFLVS